MKNSYINTLKSRLSENRKKAFDHFDEAEKLSGSKKVPADLPELLALLGRGHFDKAELISHLLSHELPNHTCGCDKHEVEQLVTEANVLISQLKKEIERVMG